MRPLALLLIGLFLPFAAFAQMGPMGGPPPEALTSCQGVAENSPCSFQTQRGAITGACRNMMGQVVCVPAQGPGGMGQGPQGPQGMQGQGTMGQGPQGMQGQGRGQRGGGQGGGPGRMGGYTPNPPYAGAIPLNNRLADTGQVTCFDNDRTISCPAEGEAFFGQDAHYASRPAAYRDNGDGTVSDGNTGLIWQKGHNAERLTFAKAKYACESLTLGGQSGWRLPTIKELFTITHWQGATGSRPFLDKTYFDIEKPDASILQGDRFASTHNVDMMGQTWSSTIYAGDHYGRRGVKGAFFFNFLDGRIKQAPIQGNMGLFYRCVKGPVWGANQFSAQGDGTVTDGLTGLTWQQADDGLARDWPTALSYCENLTLAGQTDWRLPNVKELQSIVDYSRNNPAIDPNYFAQWDAAGWFWSSTTHGERPNTADYVCFGKCISANNVDSHGAGAQRSDPKTGNASQWGAMGGQQDQVRIQNYARCVRG